MSFTATGAKLKQQAFILADGILATVTFDVSENETHKSTAKVTDHPVEQGANVADHIQDMPDTLDLVARVSNTPIVSESEAVLLDPQRAEAAYQTLRTMKKAATTCQVLTTLRSYTNMAITSVSVTRNASTGDVLAVTVSLQEIRTATSETIAAPTPKVARGNKSLDQGKKATSNAPAAVDEKSKTVLLKFLQKTSDNVAKLSQ